MTSLEQRATLKTNINKMQFSLSKSVEVLTSALFVFRASIKL